MGEGFLSKGKRVEELAKTLMEPEIKEREIMASLVTAKHYVTENEALQQVAHQYGMTPDEVKAIVEKKPLPQR